MILMSKFLRDVALRVNGADEILISHEIEATIRQFCEEGWAWPVTLDDLSLKAGNDRLYLEPMPEQTRVSVIQRVTFAPEGGLSRLLAPVYKVPKSLPDSDQPSVFYMEEPGFMRLMPAPKKSFPKSLSVDMTVIPDCWNTQLPDFFWTHHRDAIITGALSRLLSIPGRPWSNPQPALTAGMQFRNYVKRTREVVGRRWSMGPSHWVYPQFADGQPYNRGGVYGQFSWGVR